MESEIKKIFQISGYLLRTFANGLGAIARHIESLAERPSGQEPQPETDAGSEKHKTARAKTQGPTKTDIIMGVIAGAEDGADVDAIARKTGFDKGTIRSAASRLRKQGKIANKKQGVYTAS